MKGVSWTSFLLASVLYLFSRCAAADRRLSPPQDVFLRNITIYRRHEWDPPFFTNPPEVYLSCDDGRPSIDLGHVDVEHRNYQFNPGAVRATTVSKTGPCVKCHLKESDPTTLLADDIFGDFPLCYHQFTETGSHIAFIPGQFRMGFECLDCLVIPEPPVPVPEPEVEVPEVVPPAPEPMEPDDDLEEMGAAEPSMEAMDDLDEDPIGEYYVFTPLPVKEENETEVSLKSEESDKSDIENVLETGSSSSGLSTAAVMSLCFAFLFVGVVIGVFVYRRYLGKKMNEHMMVAVFEMTKKEKTVT